MANEERFYERITSFQENIMKMEKRRLELEKELFTYCRSDKRVSQIKCSKLRSYLKEICDREAQAKMRNLELLRDVECIEISMKKYSPNHGPLQQQKADYLKKISRFMETRKKTEQHILTPKAEAIHRQQRDSYTSHTEKDFTQSPVGIFMDHQTSKGSDAGVGTTSVHSDQALHHSPNRSLHSRERLPSGLLKDFRVGGEDAASKRAHLSDDISGSNDSPDGCNLSDKHERTTGLLPFDPTLKGTAGSASFGNDDEQEPSPPVTLEDPEKNLSSDRGCHTRAETSSAEHIDSQEVAHQLHIMKDEERALGHGRQAQESPVERCQSIATPTSDAQLSESSASDLTISLTQSELDEDMLEGVASQNGTYGESRDNNLCNPESAPLSDESRNTPQFNSESSAHALALESLSEERVFNLLDSIEGRVHSKQTGLYEVSSIDGRQLNRMISLCDDGADLNDKDLEACGAVVLCGLQRLSWSTEKGCLLPQDLVSAHMSSTDLNKISTSLPPNAARLWDRWFKHALVLKERRVLSTERLVQLFTPLFVARRATYSHQAKVLLRTLLSRSSEECPSAEDESDLSSLCGPSSLLADADVKPARTTQKQQIQELQSTEEDSQDESPVESGPIRETKAYQLLKQSAMQARLQSSEEEDEDGLLGINQVHEEDVERAKCSSHQDPYPRREKTESKAHSALQSEAFWGESDDSNSEIEAALRPQPFNTNKR